MSEALQCIPIFYYISKSLLFFYSYFSLFHHQHHPSTYSLTLNTPNTHSAVQEQCHFFQRVVICVIPSTFRRQWRQWDEKKLSESSCEPPTVAVLMEMEGLNDEWWSWGDQRRVDLGGCGWRWNTKKLNKNGYRNVRLPHRNKKNWIFLLLFLPSFFVHFHFCCCISTFFLIYNIARVLDRKKWHL